MPTEHTKVSHHVWYRVFQHESGPFYGLECVKLGKGYFIDLWPCTFEMLAASLEKSRNRSARTKRKVVIFLFYSRFLDPMILPLLRFCLLSRRERANRGTLNTPAK